MEPIKQLAQKLAGEGIPCRLDEPLKKHTTFRIGGPAACFCTPKKVRQVKAAVAMARQAAIPYYILGLGSNVLFPDEGYAGLVICLTELAGQSEASGYELVAAAGMPLSELCVVALGKRLSGLEFAYGIPGTVGGAVYMNAGAYDGEMRQVVQSVTCLDEDLNEVMLTAEEAGFGYRTSVFQARQMVILSAVFQLIPGEAEEIDAKMRQNMASRREKQPLELPSAGSTFKRPEGAYAGALIEQCGLRGYRVGGAAVSEKHCGFVVNVDEATCADVVALADHVSAAVREQTGFVLEREIRVVGEDTCGGTQ